MKVKVNESGSATAPFKQMQTGHFILIVIVLAFLQKHTRDNTIRDPN